MKTTLLIATLVLSLASYSQPEAKKPPYMHYLYNSGWLIQTPGHAILIDFVPHAESGITLDYVKKLLEMSVARGQKILVMVTHDHNDHFDPAILQLSNSVSGIEYILGWKYQSNSAANVHTLNAGDSLIGPDYKVYTHAATDDGVGFLLHIDGYSIYHAGDHALWAEQLLKSFTGELKLIRSKTEQVDLAFLPAARGLFTKCAYDSLIERGLELSLDILKPGTVALQHVGCKDKLSVYGTAYKNLSIKFKPRFWIIPSRFNHQFPTKAY